MTRASMLAACALVVAMGCDKPPPPPVHDAGIAAASGSPAPKIAASSALCFGVQCAKGELCIDASHARDAGTPYACVAVPAACGDRPTCDCLLGADLAFSCPAPNRLLCSENAAGEAQVVCMTIFE